MSDSITQVGIVQNMLGDAIALTVRRKYGNADPSYMRITEHGFSAWEQYDESVMLARDPTMHITDETARAILHALMNHYHGTENTRTVREDLLHERGRVDKLMEAIADLADKAMDAVVVGS